VGRSVEVVGAGVGLRREHVARRNTDTAMSTRSNKPSSKVLDEDFDMASLLI
jgi:hypothetical protein